VRARERAEEYGKVKKKAGRGPEKETYACVRKFRACSGGTDQIEGKKPASFMRVCKGNNLGQQASAVLS